MTPRGLLESQPGIILSAQPAIPYHFDVDTPVLELPLSHHVTWRDPLLQVSVSPPVSREE